MSSSDSATGSAPDDNDSPATCQHASRKRALWTEANGKAASWRRNNTMKVVGLVRNKNDRNPMNWGVMVDEETLDDAGFVEMRKKVQIRTQRELDAPKEKKCEKCGDGGGGKKDKKEGGCMVM